MAKHPKYALDTRSPQARLHRLQRTILTTSARFVRSGRRLSMIIERRFADFWQTILAQLDRWSWALRCA